MLMQVNEAKARQQQSLSVSGAETLILFPNVVRKKRIFHLHALPPTYTYVTFFNLQNQTNKEKRPTELVG